MPRPDLLDEALSRLLATNKKGWGAFVAVGLRRPGLTRYQRGTERDLVALPAVFVDLDDPSSDALRRLRDLRPTPSCITFTGGGYHAYWWLDQPLTDMTRARHVLRGLQREVGGDPMSPVQCLRLPESHNTKPHRQNTLCQIIELNDRYHPVTAFNHLLPRQTPPRKRRAPRQTGPRRSGDTLNPALIQAVTDRLTHMGYSSRGEWLSGPCLYPERHKNGDAHSSFGFNVHSGYGNCYVCGSILLKDICTEIGIHPADYGGLFV
ncbi:MAG: DNA-primase RepB domain-containing protein [Pseudomonadota bacterium]